MSAGAWPHKAQKAENNLMIAEETCRQLSSPIAPTFPVNNQPQFKIFIFNEELLSSAATPGPSA